MARRPSGVWYSVCFVPSLSPVTSPQHVSCSSSGSPGHGGKMWSEGRVGGVEGVYVVLSVISTVEGLRRLQALQSANL